MYVAVIKYSINGIAVKSLSLCLSLVRWGLLLMRNDESRGQPLHAPLLIAGHDGV